jgi:DNA-binding Xre family transcriptional regulator
LQYYYCYEKIIQKIEKQDVARYEKAAPVRYKKISRVCSGSECPVDDILHHSQCADADE